MAAKVLSLQERKKVDERAGRIGLAYDLGDLRGSYGGGYGPSTVGCGIFLVMGSLLFGLSVAGLAARQSPAAGVAGLVAVLALIALGVLLIRKSPREKVDWVFLYTGGLAQLVDGRPEPLVIPWAGLGPTAKILRASDEEAPRLIAVRAVGQDGTVITADERYGGPIKLLAEQLDAVVVAARLPLAIRRFESGAPVFFGELAVAPEGIAWGHGAKRFAWSGIRLLRLSEAEISVDIGFWKMSRSLLLTEIPDSRVAVLLIQEVAGRLGVRVDGDPLRLPEQPPSLAEVRRANTPLLSDVEVTEAVCRRMAAVVGVNAGGLGLGIFEGEGVRLSIALMREGPFGSLNRAVGGRFGRVLPGIGDRAWLVNADRTGILRSGTHTVKLTLTGIPQPERAGALEPLMRLVAARLPM